MSSIAFIQTTYTHTHPPSWKPNVFSRLPFNPTPYQLKIWSGFAIQFSEHTLKDAISKHHLSSLPFAETEWKAGEPKVVKEGELEKDTPEYVPSEKDLEVIQRKEEVEPQESVGDSPVDLEAKLLYANKEKKTKGA